ncbi:MAG: hypothetical protein EA425_13590 [Puniceicoccaceae bacterium]|nr:MAG: hypothetical protein EA425_13590 [Puniceicoccaceae bacterium]
MNESNEEIPDRRRGRLVLRLDPATLRDAERLAADNAAGPLEEVLAGLLEDMAVAWDRPGSWEAAAVCGWLSSHPWPQRPGDTEGGAL